MNATEATTSGTEGLAAPEAQQTPRRFPWGRVGVWTVIVGTVGLWGYAFLWPQPVFGRLDDTTFPRAAEGVCAPERAAVDALPKAAEQGTDNVARAATVREANAHMDTMLTALEALPRGDEKASRSVTEWLADYRAYLGNRRAYADELEKDRNARLYLTKSDRDQRDIASAIDRFADVNKMLSCMVFTDVA